MSDSIRMPTQDGSAAGELWYGLLADPTLASHVWSGREWRPLLTDEDVLNAEIKALRAEIDELHALMGYHIAERGRLIDRIDERDAEIKRLRKELEYIAKGGLAYPEKHARAAIAKAEGEQQ